MQPKKVQLFNYQMTYIISFKTTLFLLGTYTKNRESPKYLMFTKES